VSEVKHNRIRVQNPVPSIVSLYCGHTNLFYPVPRLNELVYCRRCGDYRVVTGIMRQWWWHCPKCRFSKRHGTDQDGCVRKATAHYRRLCHPVQLKWGDNTVEIIGPDPAQLKIDH